MNESSHSSAAIRAWEESSISAWPALKTEIHDGWILRAAGGYSKRSNSVNPLNPGAGTTLDRIAAAERFCRENGFPPTFKLTAACEPPDLDEILAASGYHRENMVSVQRSLLQDLPAGTDEARLESRVSDDWFSDWTSLSRSKPEQAETIRKVLERVDPVCAFASIQRDGRAAACGLGVLRAGRLWLFDIIVSEEMRRRGLGRRLVGDLLAWGRRQGAREALLQVLCENEPAKALYAGFDFYEVYSYWYRVRN